MASCNQQPYIPFVFTLVTFWQFGMDPVLQNVVLLSPRRVYVKAFHTSRGYVDWLIDYMWVRDLTAPMHLGLNDGPFVPQIKSWEPCHFTEVPDGPQD
jgi:hypothetical protein